ncbi:TolB family protein [Ekhidna sp.]
MKIFIFLSVQFFLFFNLYAQESSTYLGQDTPDLDPQVFAEEFLPKGAYLHTVSFTADGKECYFTAESRAYNGGTIMVSKLENGKWTNPKPAPIPGTYREIDPLITPDGSAMLYCTNRPVNEGDAVTGNMDIWMIKRVGQSWGKPMYLGADVNTEGQDWFPTITRSGTLYFSPWIGDVSNIHTSMMKDGKYQKSRKLSDQVNSPNLDYDPLISPDESFLIFCSDRPNGYGDVDLYVCFKKENGSWTKAKNMGNRINTEGAEFAPTISPDGKYLFFARDKQIYWVKSDIINQFKSR